MSILFYKKPEFVEKGSDLSKSSCQKYVERAACSRAVIPTELSFENVIEGRSLPPCTLQDFLDYLIYVSHDAENLQFFLWLRDYTRRFNSLPAEAKALSKPWNEPTPLPSALKMMSAPQSPLDPGMMKPLPPEPEIPNFPAAPSVERLHIKFPDTESLILKAMPRLSTDSTLYSSTSPPPSPMTASAQPFRDEIDRIIDHYLVAGAPRELNLSARDRMLALRALTYTTHPSALGLIGDLCEQALRHHSHRNFVRWSICNGNKPRIFVLRSLAVAVLLSVAITSILLILSRASRWYRLIAFPVLYFGCVNLIAARQGLCVLLHRRHTRERRPWEIDERTERRGSAEPTPWDEVPSDGGEAGRPQSRKTWRERISPMGPANAYTEESWVKKWERRTHWQQIRIQKVRITDNGGLRMIQNRIVWQAEAWGLLLTIVVMAGITAFPQFGLLR